MNIKLGLQCILDALFPFLCLECESYGSAWCSGCIEKTKNNYLVINNDKNNYLYYLCAYRDGEVITKAVHSCKYGGVEQIGYILGEILGNAILKSGVNIQDLVLVPIPLHLRRLAERGFNQSLFMASGVSSILGVPVINALRRVRYTKQQALLNKEERCKNMMQAFSPNFEYQKSIEGKTVWLIDDVFTTGSTMFAAKEACGALKPIEVYGLAVLKD